MTKGRKRIITAAVGALLLVWIVVAMRPTPVEVDAGIVSRGAMRVTVDSEGETRVDEQYTVSAPSTGVISRIELRQGDSVRAGAIVARLTPVPLDPAARAQTQAQLSAAVAMNQAAETGAEEARRVLEQARRTAERIRVLYEAGGTSRQELDQAELALSSAQSGYDSARARARAAAADVESIRALLSLGVEGGRAEATPIRAPQGGRVLRVHERSQRTVPAGTPLIDIGDPSELEVVAEVLSTDAVRVHAGQTMLIEDWGGPDTLRAAVRTVGPGAVPRITALGVEEQRVEVVGELRNPPAALGDGYRVTARIIVWERPTELRVPVAALFRRDEAWAVFRIEDDRARLRSVRIGERGAEWAQVLEGLAEGDLIVLYPSDRVVEGAPVNAR